jgi:hypothetical protein
MRISLLALATLAAAFSVGCNSIGSGAGRGGGTALAQHSCPYCNREAAICQQCEREAAEQQFVQQQYAQQLYGQQLYAQQQAVQQDIQLAGHNAPCPNCAPTADGAAGSAGYSPDGAPAYGGPYEGYGPYANYGPRPGRPGRPFDGGWYGPFGGAHRTPGYPKHHFTREYVGPQGPPTAQVAYPYYTCRGPRDFLVDNPPSIGR